MDKRINIDTELLPCPFCGCEPDFLLDEDNCSYVTCHSCNYEMRAYRPGFEHMAIAAWNRRTTPPATGETELPPLPEPDECGLEDGTRTGYYELFRTDKVLQFGRDAIAHYLREQAGQVGEPVAYACPSGLERLARVRDGYADSALLVVHAKQGGDYTVPLHAAARQEGEQPTINKGEN
jgi:Lar family restriction alleviation protein